MSETERQDDSSPPEPDEVGAQPGAGSEPDTAIGRGTAGIDRGSLIPERPVREDLDEEGKLRSRDL